MQVQPLDLSFRGAAVSAHSARDSLAATSLTGRAPAGAANRHGRGFGLVNNRLAAGCSQTL